MNESIDMLSKLPLFALIAALLIEIAVLVVIIHALAITDKKSKKKSAGQPGEKMSPLISDEYKAAFKVIEKKLNELSERCDSHARRLEQLESQSSGKAASSPAGLENKVNELQKVIFSIVEKIKEFQ